MIFQDSFEILRYIESLKSDFNDLAVFLAKIQLAGSYLKDIATDVVGPEVRPGPLISIKNTGKSTQKRDDSVNHL